MKRLLLLASGLALGALLASNLGTSAQQSGPPSAIQRHIDDWNRGDLAATLAGYTGDAIYESAPGCMPCMGQEAVRQALLPNFSPLTRLKLASTETNGSTVTTHEEFRSDGLSRLGTERIVLVVSYKLQDDKIAHEVVDVDRADAQTAQYLQAVGRQQAQAPITPVSTAWFDASGQPDEVDVVQRVVEFPPGAAVVTHFHGGNQYVTLLQGELTVHIYGAERTYRAGDSWVEPKGELHFGGNRSGQLARVVTTAVLPRDAALTTNMPAEGEEAPAIAPVIVSEARFQASGQPDEMEVVQRVVAFTPGAEVAPHFHGGNQYVTLLEGELSMHIFDADQPLQAGDSWVEPMGEIHSGVIGVAPVRLVATALLPKGAPLTTNVTP